MAGIITGIVIVIILFLIANYKVEKDEKREALWEEKANEKFGPKIEQFKNTIETFKTMMYRNDIVKMHGKEYIITGVDYHPKTYQYAGDCTYESFAYWTISLKLIDEDPKMEKEITIDIDEFTKNMED